MSAKVARRICPRVLLSSVATGRYSRGRAAIASQGLRAWRQKKPINPKHLNPKPLNPKPFGQP